MAPLASSSSICAVTALFTAPSSSVTMSPLMVAAGAPSTRVTEPCDSTWRDIGDVAQGRLRARCRRASASRPSSEVAVEESILSVTGDRVAIRAGDGAQRLAHEHVADVARDLGRGGAEHDGLVGVDRDEHRGHAAGQVALDVDHVGLAGQRGEHGVVGLS